MTIKLWPASDLDRVTCCPVCGGKERDLLYFGLTDRVFGVADGEWNIYQCSTCRSGYLDPRPTLGSIGRAYVRYYTHNTEYPSVVRRSGRMRSLLHDLINGYQNKRFGLKRTPALPLGRWLIPLMPSLRAAADAECRHLPKLPVDGGRLLDVGCGNGAFLVLATQAGWCASGIDFDAAAIEIAKSRGLDVRLGGGELLRDKKEFYDVITLCHVLEHIHNPKDLIHQLYDSLKPGGMLWIDTPNLQSIGARRFGPSWRDLDPPRHLVLFNSDSLIGCLGDAGFSSLKKYWRGMSVFDVFSASEEIERGGVGVGASHRGRPPLRDVFTELAEMLVPSSREFLTYAVRK